MDFALIMFVLLVVCGSVWLLDLFNLRRKREVAVQQALKSRGAELERRSVESEDEFNDRVKKIHDEIQRTIGAEPWWVEYSRSFFPVILAVFMLRSFLVEPFKIPSGSMIPTLHVGDFILVNKYTYGIRLPIINKKVIQINNPARGDVMVFHYPENPSIDFIKRVVGIPGDTIEYHNKQVYVNGQLQPQTADGEYNYVEGDLKFVHTERHTENLDGHSHSLLINPDMPDIHLQAVADFPYRENCSYSTEEFRCKVPEGNYFMMGDNRDNSRDSRYWGFVPDSMIVGRAFLIWMNFGELNRIGTPVK